LQHGDGILQLILRSYVLLAVLADLEVLQQLLLRNHLVQYILLVLVVIALLLSLLLRLFSSLILLHKAIRPLHLLIHWLGLKGTVSSVGADVGGLLIHLLLGQLLGI
jgi:hypothetical protein